MESSQGQSERAEAAVILEVVEHPATRGCSPSDRRTFRNRTVPRLREEFGDALRILWSEPPAESCTLPSFSFNGRPVHSGGYLPWEILRPMVAWALAIETGTQELAQEAANTLAAQGIEAEDWQSGFLEWLRRCRE